MKKERFMKDFNGEKVFCLEYDKETLTDMVLELQARIDKAIEYIERVMTIMKEQPRTDVDDFWILEKLQIF